MKEPYIAVNGSAQTETRDAFCIRNPEYVLDGAVTQHTGDMWIPKANILDDSLEVIDEATRDDKIEIYVAKWFMKDQ